MKSENLVGRRFGEMTVIGVAPSRRRPDRGTMKMWLCRCDCGETREVETQNLKRRSPSCGCQKRFKISKNLVVHGHTKGRASSPEYRCWASMHKRCRKPMPKDQKFYSGIRVCDRWSGSDGFSNFLADMGSRPSAKHSIDRVDNQKGYEPANCRWATKKQQSVNRRNVRMVTFNGRTQCIADWARQMGVDSRLIYARFKRGWSVEKSLSV